MPIWLQSGKLLREKTPGHFLRKKEEREIIEVKKAGSPKKWGSTPAW